MADLGSGGAAQYPNPANDVIDAKTDQATVPESIPLGVGQNPPEPTAAVVAETPQTTGQLWPPGAAINYVAPPLPTVRAVTSANNGGAGVTSMTVALPAGVQVDDMLIVMLCSADTQSGAAITESSTGWSIPTAHSDVGTMHWGFMYARYSAGLAMPSWTLAAARKCGYVCVALKDCGNTPGTTGQDVSVSSVDLVAPSKPFAGNNLWLRMFVRKDSLSTGVTVPSDCTLVAGSLGTATGPSVHVLAYTQVTGAGPGMPSATATFTAASANGRGWSIGV